MANLWIGTEAVYGLLNRNTWRLPLWALFIMCYISCQAILYAQGPVGAQGPGGAPWEHLTLEGFLAFVVSVQYRENREKEQTARQLAVDSAAAIAKVTTLMVDVTGALERLSQKVTA